MRKNIKNIVGSVIFILIAVIALVPISYMFRPTDGGISRFVMSGFYAEDEDTLDVITLGSSSMYRFLNNPLLWEEYGITSYNFATSSQQTDMYIPLIKEALKTQKPDLFVIETRAYIKYFTEKEALDITFRRVSDNMKYSWDRIEMINEYEPDLEKRLTWYFDLISYHGQWESLELKNIKYYDNENKRPLKSWKNIYKVDEIKAPLSFENVQPSPMDELQEERLLELLEFCKKEEIEVLFVATPWEMKQKYMEKALYVEQLVTEHGYKFWMGNRDWEKMGLDHTKDFYDKKHVNMWGAEKFTRFFGAYLLENYDMDLSHSKTTVKEWDNVVEKNKAEVVIGLEKHRLKEAGLLVTQEQDTESEETSEEGSSDIDMELQELEENEETEDEL